jgi:hypothetical protein
VFLHTQFQQDYPAFSPDGRWIAYNSNASGRHEVYVQAFPAGGEPVPISRAGGFAPRWRGDGEELFFAALDGSLMVAGIDTSTRFKSTVPRALFRAEITGMSYAVTRDGQRFLIVVHQANLLPNAPVTVVTNWLTKISK